MMNSEIRANDFFAGITRLLPEYHCKLVKIH